VESAAIHRVIERHAAIRPAALAVDDAEAGLTYRELNVRANACARQLLANGLRRGGHVIVTMERGPRLAIVLFAILKAGASYEWIAPTAAAGSGGEQIVIRANGCTQPSAVDVTASSSIAVEDIVARDPQPTPNLPILTRGSEIACVLRERDGAAVLVPHATVLSLQREGILASNAWSGEPGALDLWVPLMNGATAVTASRMTSSAATPCAA
jgi:non-ribosomal peptide synthetase component F